MLKTFSALVVKSVDTKDLNWKIWVLQRKLWK